MFTRIHKRFNKLIVHKELAKYYAFEYLVRYLSYDETRANKVLERHNKCVCKYNALKCFLQRRLEML